MTPAALLADLTARGVEFKVNGDKLRFRPVERLSPDEVETIRQHKAAIIKLLRSGEREAAPIISGTEHFSLWVDDPLGPWPEFIPSFHYDVRQPSRLRGFCSPAAHTLRTT